jgi:hypothetical protein
VRPVGIVGRALFSIAIAGIVAAVDPATVFAAELREGTRVPVRLQGVINSETSRIGQPITFVVTTDVLVGDTVVIKKDTPVMGVVVRARRMRWGFLQHKPRLAFRFSYTTMADGRVIGLRSSPLATGYPQVVTNRGEKGHAMLWAGGVDLFEAYVDGNYEI